MASTEKPDDEDQHRNFILSFAAQNSSPLLSLPGELRNSIYTYIFAFPTHEIGLRNLNGQSIVRSKSGQKHPRLALLLTCRQTYSETAALSLTPTTFMFESLDTMMFSKWFSVHPRTAIQHVQVSFAAEQDWSMSLCVQEVKFAEEQAARWLPNLKSVQCYLGLIKRSWMFGLHTLSWSLEDLKEKMEEHFGKSDGMKVRAHIAAGHG